jgi:hypothetical protein
LLCQSPPETAGFLLPAPLPPCPDLITARLPNAVSGYEDDFGFHEGVDLRVENASALLAEFMAPETSSVHLISDYSPRPRADIPSDLVENSRA